MTAKISEADAKTIGLLRDFANRAEQAGEWQDAIACWERIVAFPGSDFWDRYNHARAVLYSGRSADAEALLSGLSSQDEPTVTMLWADLEERRENFEKAKDLWDTAIAQGAPAYWCLYGKARAAAHLGQPDEARKIMLEALALSDREDQGIKFAASLEDAGREQTSGSLVKFALNRDPALAKAPFDDLLSELLLRMQNVESFSGAPEKRVLLAHELQERVAASTEVHENRFSIKRLQDLFGLFYRFVEPKPIIRNASILDLGSGSHNPLGFLFVQLMLGARRALAVDLEPTQNPELAFRAMAHSADIMRLEPSRIVGDYAITRDEVERNLVGFDLDALRSGSDAGLDHSRLRLLNESAAHLSIGTASIDMITSNSFLEHVEDVDAVFAEMARVTNGGGIGIHNIDSVDHSSYTGAASHPLEFLRVPATGMVNGSNRLRVHEFLPLFEQHGFAIENVTPITSISIDDGLRESFATPWQSMPSEFLELVRAVVVVRKL